jgi:quercetin dioxygenase-like cupin family protein
MPSHQARVKLRSEATAKRMSIIEVTVPAGWDGPPLHHHDFDEAFYVLEGELTLQVGSDLLSAGPGAVAFAPRGEVHTVANRADAQARYVLVCTPGGFERYFDGSGPYPETTVVGPPLGGSGPRGEPIATPERRPRVLLRAEETSGVVAMTDNVVPAGSKGPFLHSHDFDEAFYILEGELTFQLGDELITARRGELIHAPGDVPHAFTNRDGTVDARFALIIAPAGFERHFARIAAERAGVEPPPWALGDIPEVRRVGPQIGDADMAA